MAESFDSGNSVAGSVAGSVADSISLSLEDSADSAADSISLSLEDSADSADSISLSLSLEDSADSVSVCGGLYEVYDRINKIIYCEDLGENEYYECCSNQVLSSHSYVNGNLVCCDGQIPEIFSSVPRNGSPCDAIKVYGDICPADQVEVKLHPDVSSANTRTIQVPGLGNTEENFWCVSGEFLVCFWCVLGGFLVRVWVNVW